MSLKIGPKNSPESSFSCIVYILKYNKNVEYDFFNIKYEYCFQSKLKDEINVDKETEKILLGKRFDNQIYRDNKNIYYPQYKIYINYYNMETKQIMDNIMISREFNKTDDVDYDYDYDYDDNFLNMDSIFEMPLRVFSFNGGLYTNFISISTGSKKSKHIFELKIVKI